MKTLVEKVLLFLFFLSISAVAFPQGAEWADFPVTTNSQKALEFYKEGLNDLYEVRINHGSEFFKKASAADPNFIMPNVLLALNSLFFSNMDQFKEFANKALASTYPLNESEILLQNAVKKLLNDPGSNVTDIGKKILKLNPKSIMAHQLLTIFQQFAKDFEGQNKTLQAMLQLTQNPAPIYNSLGYNYLALNQVNDAWEAFNKYLKAAPKNPNAYDSMGDYYAKIEDYQKARAYFMKAYRMDTINFKFSHDKANKLKDK